MRKRFLTATLCLVISVIGFSQQKAAWQHIFSQIDKEVTDHSRAYSTLKEATEKIGHRLTGSVNGAKAEAYAFKLLKSYGLQTRYQVFEAESWSRGTLTVTINGVNYKSVTLAHSPVKATISGELIDMGNGLEEDYLSNPDAAKGKIVFASLGILPGSKEGLKNLHRSEKTALAIKYGAIGVILFNSAPGGILLTGTASVTGKLINIPAVCIGNEDGMQLKEQMKAKIAVADINMTNFSGKIKARNVIGTIKGKTIPEEKIVIGGHLDSWDLATGAIDNGIGSFAVIDMARTFAALKLRPERTIEFVLFMGEEEGLLGSEAYIEKALKDGTLKKIRYMLNFDMTNNPKGYSTGTDEDSILVKSIGAIAQGIDTSFKNTLRIGLGLHSDHQPFMLQGIPTAGASGSLSREILNCYHADCDVFSWVKDDEIRNTVRFGAMLLYGLADSHDLKAKHLPDDVLKEKLLKSGLKEPLQIAGEWRWKD
ncbi:MAG: M20/M25/M40 family metallo-hydrolase [Chitinophagaceae bacterium]|nr:M20/M25/M40 family metallo-hydrolase [Chitinophagaceae bacterium]